jgi:ABC-type transporter Mla MlaB component
LISFAPPTRVDFNNFVEVRTAGERHIDAHAESDFDFSNLAESNSAVVALLIAWFRYAHAHERKIQFSQLPVALQNLIEVSELTEMLPLQDAS